MFLFRFFSLCLLSALLWAAPVWSQIPQADVLKTLRPDHPRLLLTDERLADLKNQSKSDAVLRSGLEAVLRVADGLATTPPAATSNGQDLLGTYVNLGLAWRWTRDAKYREAALKIIAAQNAEPKWKIGQGLDAAQLTSASAVGYDWFFHEMDAATRTTMRESLVRNGLIEFGLAAYGGMDGSGQKQWWINTPYNWNHVCNGSLVLGLLAVADEETALVQNLLPKVLTSLRKGIETYNPDGVWHEGTMYWTYGSMYLAYGLSGLETALGTDFGLGDNAAGWQKTGDWLLQTRSPTNLDAAFADSGKSSWGSQRIALLWLARRYKLPYLAKADLDLYTTRKAWNPFGVVWYPDATNAPPPAAPLPTTQYFGGRVPMLFTRGAWNDSDTLWAYIKAGDNRTNHTHLDLGSFELAALGQHFAIDLGSDSYGAHQGYFTAFDRWDRIYRLSARSHNVPLVDNANQVETASAAFERLATSNSKFVGAVIDLKAVYPAAQSAKRGFAAIENHRAVLVQDEFEFEQPRTVSWGLMTEATVELAGSRATLRKGGKELRATILSPTGATFRTVSAERPPPDKPNTGVTRLEIELPAQKSVRLVVLLAPVWANGAVETTTIKALDGWPQETIAGGISPKS